MNVQSIRWLFYIGIPHPSLGDDRQLALTLLQRLAYLASCNFLIGISFLQTPWHMKFSYQLLDKHITSPFKNLLVVILGVSCFPQDAAKLLRVVFWSSHYSHIFLHAVTGLAVGCICKGNECRGYHISGQYIPEGLPAVIAHIPWIDECLHFPVCALFAPLLGVLDNALQMGEGKGEVPCAAAAGVVVYQRLPGAVGPITQAPSNCRKTCHQGLSPISICAQSHCAGDRHLGHITLSHLPMLPPSAIGE